jgi:hypothetical protein
MKIIAADKYPGAADRGTTRIDQPLRRHKLDLSYVPKPPQKRTLWTILAEDGSRMRG